MDMIQTNAEKEDRYTISHYYRCKKCSNVFFIGFCCRGGYIFKVDDCNLEKINFESMMSGKELLGVRFHNKIRYSS